MLIVTTPNDLDRQSEKFEINDVKLSNLRLPMFLSEKAECILFTDGKNVKVLRNKFGDDILRDWMKHTALKYFEDQFYRF